MTRDEFYRDKTLQELQWWVYFGVDRTAQWVRVRVYTDGSADSCWQGGNEITACGTRSGIRGFLSEVGIRRLDAVLEDIEADISVAVLEDNEALAETLERRAASLVPPQDWPDAPDAVFLYSPDY